jgi:hypothetical protein
LLALSAQSALADDPTVIEDKTIQQIAEELIQELINEGDIMDEVLVARK